MTNIKLQIATVKRYTKRYQIKNGENKETISNTINLGADSPFDDGDSVFVVQELDYGEFKQNQEYKRENEQLKAEIKEFSANYQALLKDYREFSQELQELKSDNKSLTKRLEDCQEKKETLQNNIILAQNELNKQKDTIGYQAVIIAKYEEMGVWKRLTRHNPKDTTPKPETLEITTKK